MTKKIEKLLYLLDHLQLGWWSVSFLTVKTRLITFLKNVLVKKQDKKACDSIQVLNVSLFFIWKYKLERACEVDVNWTSACISQDKTRKPLVFDLLTCYLFIETIETKPLQSDVIFNLSSTLPYLYLLRIQTIQFLLGSFLTYPSHQYNYNLFLICRRNVTRGLNAHRTCEDLRFCLTTWNTGLYKALCQGLWTNRKAIFFISHEKEK